tara:strand:- start:744 stop:1199 length:456 start_codon:yes stop_codon:yes gene_type:complete
MKSKLLGKMVNVDCIITFQGKEQEFLNFDRYIQPINKSVNNQLIVEESILTSVIAKIEGSTDDLIKISLCLSNPELGGSDEEITSMGFGFLCRTNGKYYFQPDQRDELEERLVRTLGISSKTLALTKVDYNRITMDRILSENKFVNEVGYD